MEDPMNSRVFVVCGKSVEVRSQRGRHRSFVMHVMLAYVCYDRSFIDCRVIVSAQAEVLTKAFSPYGNIQSVKLVRDKGGEHTDALFLPLKLPLKL